MTKRASNWWYVVGAAGALVVGVAMSWPEEPPKRMEVHVTIPADPTTTGQVVPKPQPGRPPFIVVDKDGPVPNVTPPTELHVRGMTEAECLDAGGKYGADRLCRDVDY